MKPTFSYLYFFIGFAIIAAWNYEIFIPTSSTINQTTNTNSEVTVSKWNISKAIEVVWESQLVDEQSLTFNKVWTVTAVNVKVGDSVKKWEVIAELDNSIAQNSISTAQITVDNAQLSIAQLYEWADESKILQSKNSILETKQDIIIAEKELENLKVEQANSIADIEQNLLTTQSELSILEETQEKSTLQTLENIEKSKTDLELLKKEKEDSLWNSEVSKSATLQKIEDDFKVSLIDIQNAIEKIDLIFWVTKENENVDDKYKNYLWAKNSSAKSATKQSLQQTILLADTLEQDIQAYNYLWDIDELKIILNDIVTTYNELYKSADYGYAAADWSISSLWSLTENTIEWFKSTLNSIRTSNLSKITSIKSTINTLETLTNTALLKDSQQSDVDSKQISITNSLKDYELTLKNNSLSLEKKQQDLLTARNNYESTKKKNAIALESKENALESKKTSLKISEISLAELIEWPTSQNVAKAQNSLKQAQIKLEDAYEDLDDYKLIAPFDWNVRVVDYQSWDNLNNDTNKVISIENPNLVETLLQLDQIDIVTIEVWQEAIIEFDAYPNSPAKWQISVIDTTPTKNSWVVSYEVKVLINDPDFDKKILSWMTSTVKIITASKEDILTIKSSAITERNNQKFVNKIVWWQTEEVEIETWLTSDWVTEIISGLDQWDTLSIKAFTATTPQEEETGTSLFSTPTTTTWRWTGWGWRTR